MKVLILYKRMDSDIAINVQERLHSLKVEANLEILEGELLSSGEKLTEHIQGKLNSYTDLLAVASSITLEAWWVPFVIGIAAQNDFPIVNYIREHAIIPEYLDFWPRLKSCADLDKYVEVKKMTNKEILFERAFAFEKMTSQTSPAEKFYKNLKTALEQEKARDIDDMETKCVNLTV